MKELFLQAGLVLDDEKEQKFRRYAELLSEYNQKFNLTAIGHTILIVGIGTNIVRLAFLQT